MLDGTRQDGDRSERGVIARRKEQRAFAPQPGGELFFEQGVFTVAPAEQSRPAGAHARGLPEREHHTPVGCEREIIVRGEVDGMFDLVRLYYAITVSQTHDVEFALHAIEIAHASTASSASKKPSTSASLDDSGGTNWIVSTIGRVKTPRS